MVFVFAKFALFQKPEFVAPPNQIMLIIMALHSFEFRQVSGDWV